MLADNNKSPKTVVRMLQFSLLAGRHPAIVLEAVIPPELHLSHLDFEVETYGLQSEETNEALQNPT